MNIDQIFCAFPTSECCISFLEKARWGDEPTCPYCDSANTHPNGGRHYCYNCVSSFSVTVDTIFHKTHLPLQKWFLAILIIMDTERTVSALQLASHIGVNRNTAWRISKQIKNAMSLPEQRKIVSCVAQIGRPFGGGTSH